jgi:hypothetical protein
MTTPIPASQLGNLAQYLPPTYKDGQGNLTVSLQQATTAAQDVQQHVQNLPPTEQSLYMTMLGAPSFAPSGTASPSDVDATLGRLDNAVAALYQSGEGSGGLLALAQDVNALAVALVKQATNERTNELDQRLQAREEATAQLQAQAGQQQKAAQELQSGAIASLVLSVVSAAVSVAGAAASIAGGAKALKSMNELETPEYGAPPVPPRSGKGGGEVSETDSTIFKARNQEREANYQSQVNTRAEAVKKIDMENSKTSGLGQIGQSIGQLFQGGAGAANSFGQAAAQTDEAQGSLDAAQAQETQGIGDTAKEAQQSLQSLVDNLISALQQIQEAKADSMKWVG